MASPRYLAAHLLMPRFLRERGAPAVLDAIERGDADFFLPVWMNAGLRFTTRPSYRAQGGLRVGVLTLPLPRDTTEAYLAVVVGKTAEPAYLRYFLWEKSESLFDDKPRTVISEWAGTAHRNYGQGPPFTGELTRDSGELIARLVALCAA
jgi:hypothetical protein